jgi:hypothetical protein
VDGGAAGVAGSVPWTPADPSAVFAIGSTTSAGVNAIDGVIQKVRLCGGTVASTVPSAAGVSSITGPYRPLVGDTLLLNPTSAGFTITLPPAVTADIGKFITLKNASSSTNIVNVVPTGSDTIDGTTNYAINTAYELVKFMVASSGVWIIL